MFNERCQLHQDVYRKLYKQSMPEHQPTPPEKSYGYHGYQSSNTYTKQEAVNNVVQATVKGSRERGALIELMVVEGLVSNTIYLYRLIKRPRRVCQSKMRTGAKEVVQGSNRLKMMTGAKEGIQGRSNIKLLLKKII